MGVYRAHLINIAAAVRVNRVKGSLQLLVSEVAPLARALAIGRHRGPREEHFARLDPATLDAVGVEGILQVVGVTSHQRRLAVRLTNGEDPLV